jgi:cytochrome c-type biogenesis protein CcsB
MLTQSFASFSLPTEMQKSTALVPALQSNWLMMHVSMMILSYGALLIGSLLAVTLLVISRALPLQKIQSVSLSRTKKKEDHFLPGKIRSYSSILETAPLSFKYPLGAAPGCFAFNLETHPLEAIPKGKGFFLETNLRIEVLACSLEQLFFQARKTRLLQQMDNWSYRAIGIGFPLLTVGILSGAVWANEAWGSYWSWDPKETWALVTWVIFAVYLHTRMTKGWTGDRPAFVALLGLLVVWICYLGVNLLGQGLHSYGWLN